MFIPDFQSESLPVFTTMNVVNKRFHNSWFYRNILKIVSHLLSKLLSNIMCAYFRGVIFIVCNQRFTNASQSAIGNAFQLGTFWADSFKPKACPPSA
ncbi:MAG: hypothetical protein JWP69_1736 [Flaviaesturariibacter sp.]|nr:hypothetical protein [Flaviaesturariibacter sp.]